MPHLNISQLTNCLAHLGSESIYYSRRHFDGSHRRQNNLSSRPLALPSKRKPSISMSQKPPLGRIWTAPLPKKRPVSLWVAILLIQSPANASLSGSEIMSWVAMVRVPSWRSLPTTRVTLNLPTLLAWN
jgi:hypothetical protein